MDIPLWAYGIGGVFAILAGVVYLYILKNMNRKSKISILKQKIDSEKNIQAIREEKMRKKSEERQNLR